MEEQERTMQVSLRTQNYFKAVLRLWLFQGSAYARARLCQQFSSRFLCMLFFFKVLKVLPTRTMRLNCALIVP